MSKMIPSLLVFGFASVVTLRAGYVLYEYDKSLFNVSAYAEKVALKKTIPEQEAANKQIETPENISDRIIKHEGFAKDNVPDSFASSIPKMKKIGHPEEVCITGKLLKNALVKLQYLETREAEIQEQQKLLETTDRRLREQVAKLKLIKEEVIESAKLADSSIRKESKRLISIYEKMKPKEAAIIFNEMSPNVAAELLRTMKEDQSSAILAKMDPKNAYNVTLALAQGVKQTEQSYSDIKSSIPEEKHPEAEAGSEE